MSIGAFTDKAYRPTEDQVLEMIGPKRATWEELVQFIRKNYPFETLAYGPGNAHGLCSLEEWRAIYYDLVRMLKQSHSHSQVQKIAAQLGIRGRSHCASLQNWQRDQKIQKTGGLIHDRAT